jgi:hypothetical protein
MKKTLLLILVISAIISFDTKAQKLLKPEVDKLTGDTTWRTSDEVVFAKFSFGGANQTVSVQGLKIASSYVLSVTVVSPSTNPYYALDGGKIFFKLVDKTIITLTAAKGGMSSQAGTDAKALGMGTLNEGTKLFSYYNVTKEDLLKLKASPLEFIRVESSKGPLDFEVKKKQETLSKVCDLLASK